MPQFPRRRGVNLWISPIYEFTRCMLCGCPTRTPELAWMDLVRIIYPQDRNNISLSGLYTRYHESHLRIRSDRHIEWLDPEQDPWAMQDGEAHPYGTRPCGSFYVIHESCWQYAVLCFGNDMPSLEDIFDVFRELPPPKDPAYLHRSDYQPCVFPSASELPSLAKPYPVPQTATIRSETNPSDAFQRLPLELRQTIALQLETSELLALRQASRAMVVLFHDRFYWKQQIRDHAFLDHLLHTRRRRAPARDRGVEPDWRLLYHVGPRVLGTAETTSRVWELVAWMKEYLAAARNLKKPPLDFAGSALQLYHNDSARSGRRVQRIPVPARLAKVGICIAPTTWREPQLVSGTEENVTEITGIDFTDADGSTMTIMGAGAARPDFADSGSSNYRCVTAASLTGKTGRNLRVLLYGGRGDAWNKCQLSNLAGTRVVWDTDNASFHGFRMSYNARGIHSMAVLVGERHEHWYPQVFGYDPEGCRPIHAELEEVVEVVATWEDRRLVDLGVRGRRKRVCFQSLPGCPLPNSGVNWGRYGQIMKRKDAWDRRQPKRGRHV